MKSNEREVTLVVEKWSVKPTDGDFAKFMPHKEERIVVRETAKRFIHNANGKSSRKVFDKSTGREICARGHRSWFRFSIKIDAERTQQP